jgi:hypothetical protein
MGKALPSGYPTGMTPRNKARQPLQVRWRAARRECVGASFLEGVACNA